MKIKQNSKIKKMILILDEETMKESPPTGSGCLPLSHAVTSPLLAAGLDTSMSVGGPDYTTDYTQQYSSTLQHPYSYSGGKPPRHSPYSRHTPYHPSYHQTSLYPSRTTPAYEFTPRWECIPEIKETRYGCLSYINVFVLVTEGA